MATVARQQETLNARQRKRFRITPYLFILPHLLFFGIFVLYPFFYGLWISFHEFDYLRPERTNFVGVRNYAELFAPGTAKANEFRNALMNTAKFVLYSVPPLVFIPLLLAILLNTKTPGRNIFRAIYFAPWVLSVAVVGILWWWIFQSQGGLFNSYLVQFNNALPWLNIAVPRWLSTLPWAWVAIVIATVWWTAGFNMIIFLAALQDIPASLYEAAAIDGANGPQRFWRITLPMLQPVLLFIVIITIISSFNLFGQPFFMTQGGPRLPTGGGGTEPVMYRIYIEGFVRPLQGSAAAMSFVVATIMIVISYLNFTLFRRR